MRPFDPRVLFRFAVMLSVLVVLAACGEDDGVMVIDVDASVTDFGVDARIDVDGRVTCTSDVECNDGLFCNGREMCAPASTMADARGCIPGDAPCGLTETCDESANDCRTICEDLDGDGYESTACGGDDCDDTDATRYPGATEICDGNDEDCNDATFGFIDADMDGAGSASCCNGTNCGTDCDDANASIRPGVADGPSMNCNGIDDDCDGMPDTGCPCSDGERRPCYGGPAGTRGVGLCAEGVTICAGGVLGAECLEDVLPADEFCNGRDDDCDGIVDDGVRPRFYRDDDGDRFGRTDVFVDDRCSAPPGFAAGANDCDDENPARFPGAADLCNMVDDDCDGMTDEGAPPVTFYRDADGDGFGDATRSLSACSATTGYVAAGGDCDDTRPFVSPVGIERCDAAAVPLDENCDGSRNEGCACVEGATQSCGGGSPVRGVCRAGVQRCIAGVWGSCEGNVDPGARTEICNGDDDDCDGMTDEGLLAPSCYLDADSDGVGSGVQITTLCRDTMRGSLGECPSGYSNVSGDCNDGNAVIRPLGAELCNGADDDCDGTIDEGFECRIGTSEVCATGCGSGGTRTCGASCTWNACRAADEGPTVTGTCNGCDDDLDGRTDEGFACERNSLRTCLVTACGTPGVRVCTGTCTEAAAECRAVVEFCNYCDDDRDGDFWDDGAIATAGARYAPAACSDVTRLGTAACAGSTGCTLVGAVSYAGEALTLVDAYSELGGAWTSRFRVGWGSISGRITVDAEPVSGVDAATAVGETWGLAIASVSGTPIGTHASNGGLPDIGSGQGVWATWRAFTPEPIGFADLISAGTYVMGAPGIGFPTDVFTPLSASMLSSGSLTGRVVQALDFELLPDDPSTPGSEAVFRLKDQGAGAWQLEVPIIAAQALRPGEFIRVGVFASTTATRRAVYRWRLGGSNDSGTASATASGTCRPDRSSVITSRVCDE
jgi:hypothetical protein